MSPMGLALEITLVGMGLVFGAILLLWGVMALIVRIAPERQAETEEIAVQEPELDRKREAAAVAVALALASAGQARPREFPEPPTAIVSAWQVVRRANLLSRRGRVR